MSPLLVHALRRLATLALLLAFGLVAYFRVLPAAGLVGPSAEDRLDGARAALATARAYGAKPQDQAYVVAIAQIEAAQKLATDGHGRAARLAAAQAQERAVDAQAAALATREANRRGAHAIVGQIDDRLNALEDLYSEVSPGLDKATTSRLLASMKGARQEGAGLVLAFEQDNFEKVIADEPAATARLGEVKAELESFRKIKR